MKSGNAQLAYLKEKKHWLNLNVFRCTGYGSWWSSAARTECFIWSVSVLNYRTGVSTSFLLHSNGVVGVDESMRGTAKPTYLKVDILGGNLNEGFTVSNSRVEVVLRQALHELSYRGETFFNFNNRKTNSLYSKTKLNKITEELWCFYSAIWKSPTVIL